MATNHDKIKLNFKVVVSLGGAVVLLAVVGLLAKFPSSPQDTNNLGLGSNLNLSDTKTNTVKLLSFSNKRPTRCKFRVILLPLI